LPRFLRLGVQRGAGVAVRRRSGGGKAWEVGHVAAGRDETRLYADRPSRRTVHASTDVAVSPRPVVLGESLQNGFLRRSGDCVKDLATTLERSSEHDETLVD